MKNVVISGTAKSRQSDDQDDPRSPLGTKTCYQQIDNEKLKQHEREPHREPDAKHARKGTRAGVDRSGFFRIAG